MSILSRSISVLTIRTCSLRALTRSASFDSSKVKQVAEDDIKKSVFISQSTDIHTNLALEDWLYRNYDFTNHHVLLLWKNDPCVVIGRHQNPWVESNVSAVEEMGISLARRNSGGGTVYHDHGNVNLSFFTPRERYNRRYNLEIITRALYREWGLKAEINKREDIIVQGNFKVSGTAAKLGRPNAYHHCTLLVGVDKSLLSTALEKKESGIATNATQSVRSPVKNLMEINSQIQTDALMNALGWEYLRTRALNLVDGGHNLVSQQKGFQMINPTEEWFPGLEKLKNEYKSWDWTFGKSPKFTVTRTVDMPAENGQFHALTLTLSVENGIVEDIKMSLPKDVAQADGIEHASVITSLRGSEYNYGIMDQIITAMGCKSANATKNVNKSNIAVTL
ncbi:lipoyltransferase 1, mitochondrial isoform X1 [Venturia canescens]|uniref:lipoyltransferase 1, mitochondrial isoform X1 n=1 Tax=Venturia canescens TaxID=32260 RepID=UPI001C9D5777|nr:lipoyltransferase 1, mitochondrial isoform X1 [Venturia canescens]